MMDLALLLQAKATAARPPSASSSFFAGFFLIISLYTGFLGFTYWISKDE